jgi:hypothetical protein
VDGARVLVLVGGWDEGCEVSAKYEAVRLFLERDCFLSRRLIVSAYIVKVITPSVHQGSIETYFFVFQSLLGHVLPFPGGFLAPKSNLGIVERLFLA